MAGLLGMGGLSGALGGAPRSNMTIAQLFDPTSMRNQQLKQGLLSAGIAMMNPDPRMPPSGILGSIGRAGAGGLQGAQQGKQDFLNNGMMSVQLSQLQREQDQRDQQSKALEAFKKSPEYAALPPTAKSYIDIYPEQGLQAWAGAQMKSADPYTLGKDQVRYGADNKPIAYGPVGTGAGSKSAAIQEYEYAKTQGFPGTLQDWEASKKGGMSLQMNPDGTVTFQQGGNIKPMTESQSKDTVFATRAEGASRVLEPIADELTSLGGNIAGSVPLIGNALKPEKFQQAEQAGKEFIQAILRKDTGAAITPQENIEYGSVYLPRYGDGDQVIKQKSASRARAIAALKAGMTPQAILAQEKALQSGGPASAVVPQQQGGPPAGIDPQIWQHMTPEERALWN